MESAIVVLIVLGALAWAGHETWRAIFPRRRNGGGCPSANRCAVARDCARAPEPEPSDAPGEAPRHRREPKLTNRQSS